MPLRRDEGGNRRGAPGADQPTWCTLPSAIRFLETYFPNRRVSPVVYYRIHHLVVDERPLNREQPGLPLPICTQKFDLVCCLRLIKLHYENGVVIKAGTRTFRLKVDGEFPVRGNGK